ncbi:auxin efflux carrier [Phascolomyces articulosus]|uniref:Auxin efflux carrier n=1 Tax=Phascolomyces articulosus TaxID=60185 RepID=A0AAD5JVZ7_9FUNG|nr:auxin efflux carrier [Phascolomyces articulosus]
MMLNLILAAIQSILQVMVVVLFGFILTRAGYFSTDKQKWLSRLNLVFFTPCLLFSNIASVISFQQLLAYWPIPVFYMCFASLSFACAHIISRIFRLETAYRRFVLACVMFSNTNSLPIAVITSLAVSEAGKVLFWGADDNQQAVAARGISYALFYAIFGNLLRWSYGYSLLQRWEEDDEDDDTSTVADYTDRRDQLSSPRLEYGSMRSSSVTSSTASSMANVDTRRTSSVTLEGNQGHLTPITTKQKPNETTNLLSFPTLPSDDLEASSNNAATHEPKGTIPHTGYIVVRTAKKINKYMTPPLYAALLALVVGLIPPLKHLMFDKSSFLYPCLTSAIQNCGRAAVPLILVCLGAQLTDIYHSPQNNQVKYRPVATAISTRMFLMPLLVIPIVLTFVAYGEQWSAIAADPVFSVMMIILGCTPTAINLVQISQVTGCFENEMLRVLFWSYGVICVPIFTLIVFLALNIVDKFV